MRFLRIAGIVVAVPVALVLIALLVSVIMSPPGAGQKTATALGAPYRAVVAHRGASHLAPEGTAPAYLLAREMGADYLEADLQRTADGVIVVFHDDTLARTTDVAKVFPGREDDFIETFTYDELMQLDTGSWFNEQFPERARPSFTGERILTLEQLLNIAASGTHRSGLYLETKASERHTGYEVQIVDMLRDKHWLAPAGTAAPATTATGSKVIFQSFNPSSLEQLQQLAPHTARVLLISTETEAEHGWDNLLNVAVDTGHGIGPIGFLAWPWNTGAAHKRGLIVHPYTINASWQMRLLTLFGVDGIFTDRPEVALEVFGRVDHVDIEALFRSIGY